MSDLTPRFDTSDLADFLCAPPQWCAPVEQELFACELVEIDECEAQIIEAGSL